MADVQLDADLIIRLKNLDKALNEIKRKLSSINLPEFKFSAQAGRDFNNFIRVLSQSGPQVQAAARNINQFTAAISASAGKLNAAAPGLRAFASAMNAINASSRSSARGVQEATSRMEDLGRQTALTLRRFGGFLVARNLIYGLAGGFRSVVSEAITFERELSKIAQLQNNTLEGTRSLGRFIGELAIKFGASATELARSAQVLAQAGKSTAEIRTILQGLGQASLTPTFGNLEKTTDSLLAVLGQFNIKAAESAEVLDVLNEVSKDFNVSVDELFEGVRRAGSTFAELSGVRQGVKPGIDSLKEFVALFTAVIDTSRESAETIGTAFRTILPRLLRGETRELLKRELGLDLLDDQNQFIGPFKAIEKLFNALSRFSGTDVGLTKIVEELGGSRQFNRVLPLILEFPKAQRAMEIASRSSGSVAKDTKVAYETLAVQLQQIREQFLQLGRDLTENGTFKVLADSFVLAAKSAAVLVKSLEPLLPLIVTLGTISAGKSLLSFTRGAFFDNAFAMGPVRRAGGGSIGKIDALLTPGELTFSPDAVRMNGESALRRFNATGDISALRTLKGASIVPGSGNVDSVHANLEPGSFVVRKASVQKALGFKKFAMGGPVRLNQGGQPANILQSLLSVFTNLDKKSRLLNPKETKLLEPVLQKIAKMLGANDDRFRFIESNAPYRGIAQPGRGFVLNTRSTESDPLSVNNRTRTFLHEASHFTGADTTRIPEYAFERGVQFYGRRRNYIAQNNPNSLYNTPFPLKEGVASQFNITDELNDPRAQAAYLNRIRSSNNPRQEFAAITREIAEKNALKGAPKVFQDLNPQLRTVFFNIQDSFVKEAKKIGASFEVIKSEWMTVVKRSKDLSELQLNSNRRLQSVLQPAFSGNKDFVQLDTAERASYAIAQGQYKGTPPEIAAKLIEYDQQRQGFRASRTVDLAAYNAYASQQKSGSRIGRVLNGAKAKINYGLDRTASFFQGTNLGFNDPQTISQLKAAAPAIAAISAMTAGGYISSGAKSSGAAGLGGALSGAGTGALLGSTIPGFGTALGALIGALSGAILSVKSFSEELEQANFDKLLRDFTAGKATPEEVSSKLNEFINQGPINKSEKINYIQDKDLVRTSIALREQFAPFAEQQSVLLQEKIVQRAQKGEKLNPDALLKELSPAQLKVLAAGDVRLQSTDNEGAALAIGTDVAKSLIKQQLDAISATQRVAEAMRRLGQSTTLLSSLFEATDARLRETEVTLSNFSNKIDRIVNPGNITTDSRFNVFSNVAGIPQSRVIDEIGRIERRAGVVRSTAGDAAVLATQLINELPAQIAAAQSANPEQTVGDFLTGQFKGVPAGLVGNTLNNLVSTIGEESLGNVDPKKLTSDVSGAFEPALKIFEKIADLMQQERDLAASALRERANVGSRIIDRNLSINGLNDQASDARLAFFRGETPSIGEAQARLNRDVAAITGGPTDAASIAAEMDRLRQGGVQPAEAEQYNRLQRGLETLASDTRVLDATMRKSNELAQAAQGSKSFLERALGGPDEINKINQEARDLQAISQGQQLSGPRTLAALRLSEQLQGAFTPEQIQQQFGISAADFRNNTNSLLGRSASANFAANSAGLANVMSQNLQPNRQLLNSQMQALATQQGAQETLRSFDEQAVIDIDKALKENAAFFSDAIGKALTAPPVQEFTNAINTLANSELKLGGSVDVVVSFNNPQGVLSTIQDDLKTFVSRVVDDRVKVALSQQVANANTA